MPTDMQISVQLSYKLPSGEACVADVKRAFQVLERELLAVTLPLPPGAAISGPLILKVERAERSDSSSTLNDESAIGQVKGPLSDSNNQPTATVAPSFGPYGPIQQPAEDVSCTVQRLASQDTVDPALLPCYDRAGATVVARYVWPSMDRTRRLRALQDGLYMRAAHALKHGWQGDINGGDQRPLLKDILLSGMAAGGKVPPVDFTEASGRLYSRTVAQVQAFVASGGHSLGQSDAISASRTPAVAHDNGVASTVGSVPMPPSLAPSDALLQGPRPWNMKRQSSVPSIPGANGRDLSPQEWIVFDQNDGAQPRLAFERRANGPQPHPTGGQGYSSAAPPGSDRGFQIAGANNFDGPRTMSLKHVHFDGLRNSAPGMIGSNGLPTDYASTTAFARPDIQRARTSEQRGMSNVWPPSK
ncbi:hypothetical protein CERSUDRAFT_111517 [Gelatoporia subvermispora B]|uniref:Uncharacterized protein n=1 Tax=Ceriporiopsis subvermispora (strain B) TaxID=914234 RepID=M2RQ05_CERS8|nr:hypothetical protein CERSUDRAFT_111517 [Gelatoporia subvermispora B]